MAFSSPVFSIITICKNSAHDLWETAQSILSQEGFAPTEFIIIDGASTDNTAEIIGNIRHAFQEKGFPLLIISEPDHGIYDAMNKGTRYAHGEWINFMNAGDRFAGNTVLKEIYQYIAASEKPADVFYGSVRQVLAFGEMTIQPRNLSYLDRKMAFCHQCAFLRKEVQEEHPYDLSFRIAADYEFFHWCYRSGKVFMKMPVTVAIFESEQGLSSRNRLLMNREYARANGRSKTISWKLEYTAKVLEVGFNKLWRSLFPQAIVNRIRQHHYSSTSL